MGGNAFPITAKRLTTPQLDLLKQHAQTTVSPFFTQVAPLRDVGSKADHGDLDLVCGWDHPLAWNWKGEDRGVMGSEGGDGLGGKIKCVSEAEARSAQAVDGETEEQKDKRELRVWCFDIAKATGAKEWVKRGSEISLAIPCSLFGDAAKEHADDPTAFYQLDLPLVPAFSVEFFLLVVSYSTAFLIFARALRCISSSLTLQMTGLIIRHPAYFGLPGIDLRLTASSEELCDYFGLDLARWREGFQTEEEVWGWMAAVQEGGKLEGAYKRMVRPKAVRQVGHKAKAGALDGFVSFLRSSTRFGEGWEDAKKSAKADGEGAKDGTSPTLTPTIIEPTPEAPSLAPPTPTVDAESSPALIPVSPSPTPSPAPTPASVPTLDPEHPVPLDPRAEDALDRWGKREAYEALLAERKEVAVVLAANQKKRIESKAKALELELAKQKEEAEKETADGKVEESLVAAVAAVEL